MTGVLCYVLATAMVLATLGSWSAPSLAEGLAERQLVPARAPQQLREDVAAKGPGITHEAGGLEVVTFLGAEGRSLLALLARTGIDPTRLLSGLLQTPEAGIGGPFQAAGDDGVLTEVEMAALVERVRATVPLASPVRDPHRLTSGFGSRRDPFRKRAAFHRGLDIAAPRGTSIYATAAGTVIRAGRAGAYGNIVEIDHGNGVRTLYAHLHEYHVRKGQAVDAGKRIGKMGRTGRVTGVHLHYEVIVDERPVNPRRFLQVGEVLLASAS